MKRKTWIIFAVVFALLIVGAIIRTNILEQQAKERRLAADTFIMNYENGRTLHYLAMSGTFSYEPPDKIIVIELKENPAGTIANVAFYNAYHEGEELTVEQLLQEYDEYCNNTKGRYGGIDSIADFYLNSLTVQRMFSGYHEKGAFEILMDTYLEETYGVEIEEATSGQIQEAAEYAKEWMQNSGYKIAY